MSPTFLAEMRRFCQTTSVRGVPRIVNSKSILQSVIWSLGVLTCSGLLVWQLIVVFHRYLSYQVTTLLVQSPAGEHVEFPDITICNLNPLVHESAMNLSYTDYYNSIYNKAIQLIGNYDPRQPNATALNTFMLNIVYFASSNAYFTNFPILPHFGSIIQNSPILACSYYSWNGVENIGYRCNNKFKDVHQRWVPSFYKCYTVSLNDSRRTNVRGSSIIMYVDDYVGQIQTPLISSDIAFTVASGMQVLVHPPGSIPDMTLGIPIGVGMSTKITIDQTKVTHLPFPYSNCTKQKTLGDVDKQTSYTVKYCTDVCLQNHYLHDCGCISNALQFTSDQFDQSNYTMCGNLSITNINSSFNWDGAIEIFCSVPILTRYQLECEYECVTPCAEFKYTLSTSAAPWPHKSSLSRLYLNYIQDNPRFKEEFETYEAFAYFNLTFSELKNLEDELDRAGLAKSRFLQLSVQFNSQSFMEQKDVASFSFDAFGAQIGGVLSLWLGVTIILIFELFEVTINLLAVSFSAKQNKPASPPEETIDTHL